MLIINHTRFHLITTQQTELCNSFVNYFDVSTKIKNNIKEITQCKQRNDLNCLLRRFN